LLQSKFSAKVDEKISVDQILIHYLISQNGLVIKRNGASKSINNDIEWCFKIHFH
jgi:hypothetical protein